MLVALNALELNECRISNLKWKFKPVISTDKFGWRVREGKEKRSRVLIVCTAHWFTGR